MAAAPESAQEPAMDAALAAALLALDPPLAGGALVRGRAGPAREAWLAGLRSLLPAGCGLRRVPAHVGAGRLLGGLDMQATLAGGRPVAERGLLAEADGQVLLLPMCERLAPIALACITSAMDRGEVTAEREGFSLAAATRFGVVALDESLGEDEAVAPALADRLGLHVALEGLRPADLRTQAEPGDLDEARALLARVRLSDEALEALCSIAASLGVASMRGPLLAARAARGLAALAGLEEVDESALSLATRLVLLPRATQLPQPDSPEEADEASNEQPPEAEPTTDEAQGQTQEAEEGGEQQPAELEEVVLDAAQAAMPPDLLRALAAAGAERGPARAGTGGRARQHRQRGRPIGHRPGTPREGARLHVLATLRAAVPWQAVRRAERDTGETRLQIRREDFQVVRYKHKTQTTTIFVVDASGSTAMQRLAESKGAVELLLAESYARRDRVALIAFRGQAAELLLPPTRSLTRARRNLAGLPGGGGTPLASGLDAARELAETVRRGGDSPMVILLTDGRANIAREGRPGREQAQADALGSARALRAGGIPALLVDTSRRPQERAQRLAAEMGARYLQLPNARAETLSREVAAAMPGGGARAA